MKNKFHRLLCVVVAVALCLSLSGCQVLDKLKAEQAHWTDDTRTAFVWKDVTYRLLPETETDLSLRCSENKTVTVTKTDVPVLLSPFLGTWMELTENEEVVEYLDYEQGGEYYCYCREDRYDAVLDALQTGNVTFNAAGYYYSGYDEIETNTYTLSKKEYAAVNAVLETVEPERFADRDLFWNTAGSVANLYQFSADGLFELAWVDICVLDDVYYLCRVDENYDEWWYTVPKEYTNVFRSLMAAQVEADATYPDDYWDDDWDEDYSADDFTTGTTIGDSPNDTESV